MPPTSYLVLPPVPTVNTNLGAVLNLLSGLMNVTSIVFRPAVLPGCHFQSVDSRH